CAIAVVVHGDYAARILQLDLIETNLSGDIFESIRAEGAEKPNLALSGFRFSDSRKINPAIVVVVDGGNPEGADPICFWQRDRFEAFTVIISPERKARSALVSKGEIHPTVMVEIKNGNTRGRRGHRCRPRVSRGKLPFARIFENSCRLSCHHQIDGAVIVVIRSEEHTSELQSRGHLVCRLLLEKKKK